MRRRPSLVLGAEPLASRFVTRSPTTGVALCGKDDKMTSVTETWEAGGSSHFCLGPTIDSPRRYITSSTDAGS
jgi:hypothetical protein